MRKTLSLASFDGRLIDGLVFCRKVYEFFEQVRTSPGGKQQLRLRDSMDLKKLIEELIPIGRYIQANYREGRRIKVRWINGNQQFDAVLQCSGGLVESGRFPQKVFLEVTTAIHKNDRWRRELLAKGEPVLGLEGISRDGSTGTLKSDVQVNSGFEVADRVARRTCEEILKKIRKTYPVETALVVSCVLEGICMKHEWDRVVEQVRTTIQQHQFREIFLVDTTWGYSANV